MGTYQVPTPSALDGQPSRSLSPLRRWTNHPWQTPPVRVLIPSLDRIGASVPAKRVQSGLVAGIRWSDWILDRYRAGTRSRPPDRRPAAPAIIRAKLRQPWLSVLLTGCLLPHVDVDGICRRTLARYRLEISKRHLCIPRAFITRMTAEWFCIRLAWFM